MAALFLHFLFPAQGRAAKPVPAPALAFLGLDKEFEAAPALILDSPEKSATVCFEVSASMEARALAVYCEQSQDAPPYLISLHQGQGGQAGKVLAQASGVHPQAQSWMQGQIDGLMLAKGDKVCLSVSPDLLRGGAHPVDKPGPSRFASFKASLAAGPAAEARLLFAVLGRGKRILGHGFAESFALPIHGNGTEADAADDRWQAQVFHFDCGFNARTLKARVRKVGNPKQPLQWVLLKHDYKAHKTSPIFEAVLAKPAKVKAAWSWLESPFPTNTGYPPECHYVALKTASGQGDAGSCTDCYEVSGLRLAKGLELVQELGFNGGAHRDRASSSVNGGHWQDDFEADLHLGILAPPCMPKDGPKAPRLLPTPAAFLP